MKPRYVNLNDSERSSLISLKRRTDSNRVMERCHCLLLSGKGYQIEQLSDIFDVRRDTIRDWFDRWESEGLAGLEDAPKSGRPRRLTPSEEKK
ncbi:MAG: helix-turn-helix domain-containing protein [Bacteroidota bacterium]